jgi:hypothetical protein
VKSHQGVFLSEVPFDYSAFSDIIGTNQPLVDRLMKTLSAG